MIKKAVLYVITLVMTITMLLTSCVTNETKKLQESTKESNKDIQSELIKYIDDYCEKNKFSGTILVAKEGDVLLNRGYGMADYENNIPNTSQTVFEIASLTKQFTATAILMLQEKKLLSVQDPIGKYIPDYPNGDKIKIYNLLTHTSGIPDYSFTSQEMGVKYTPEEIIESFKNKPLNFEVGISFNYSNSNYVLLGYIIEKVSNMKYEDYIEKNILKPLKLNKTKFLNNKLTIKDKASGYSTINKNIYTKATEAESSLTYSAAGICSTVEDIYEWENALIYTDKLIKKESLNEMLTPNLNNYGYGWSINEDGEGNKRIWHDGSLQGYTSIVGIDIDKKYMFIILDNKDKDTKAIHDIVVGLSQILKDK